MNLFADYVEPFTTWLRIHPDWALFITFIISFSESLAIIGSIIPGSVTMTAIGILAGSGIMRIDLTLLFACIGAILGDGVSYILGYILRDRLPTLWPFKRYPSWLEYGKNFFARHGGKSILLGRFVGPLRSIIPVIAGMLHMPKLEFIIANIGSGIAWSIVYVMPGILLGAASVQLSTEQATRLFILVLLILAFVWLSSRIIKWLVLRTQVFFETTVHDAWYSAKKTKRFGNILHYITPPHEINHQNTVALIVLGVMCIYLFVLLITGFLNELNSPIYFFFQSIRTQYFDSFFILGILAISPLPVLILVLSTGLLLFIKHENRTLMYLSSINLTGILLTYFFNNFISLSIPIDAIINQPQETFINPSLAMATANLLFLSMLLRKQKSTQLTRTFQLGIISLLILCGFAHLYLGDNLTSSIIASFSLGLCIYFFHWIFYRCKKRKYIPIKIPFICFICIAILFTGLNYKKTKMTYKLRTQQYVLSNHAWWNQEKPLLPIYTTNRIGQPTGVFNIQYMGSIHRFEQALKTHGWKKQKDSFLELLLIQTDKKARKIQGASYKTQLYQSQKPDLIMTYLPSNKEPQLVLRLWQSNYHLLNHTHPLWIGSIQPYSFGAVDKLTNALDTFEINTLALPPRQYKKFSSTSFSSILIVREVH